MAAVQACASSSAQNSLRLCHGQGIKLRSPTKQPVSPNTRTRSGILALVYWYNALINWKWSRRTSANQEKFHTSLSIFTTPGKLLRNRKIILVDWPIKEIYRNAALMMGEKEVSITHAERAVEMKRHSRFVQGWYKSDWRHKTTAAPTCFPQELTLSSEQSSIYNSFEPLVEKLPQMFQTSPLLPFAGCALWVHLWTTLQQNRHKSSLSAMLKLWSTEEKLPHASTSDIAEILRLNYLQRRNFQLEVSAGAAVHSVHIWTTWPHFILSPRYNLNLFTYKTRDRRKFSSINPTTGTSSL